MQKKMLVRLALILVIPALMLTVSCAKKVVDPSSSQAGIASQQEADRIAAQKAAAEAEERARIQEAELQAKALEMAALKEKFNTEDVFFAYDSSVIDAQAQAVLRDKYNWLVANPTVTIVVEGHCDNRGTGEYNLALGDKRARAALEFLTDLGVAEGRITSVSYGEEFSGSSHDTEAELAKDRRAHFKIK